jgi:AAA domain
MTIATSDTIDKSESPGGAPLPADRLYRSADLSALAFATTMDLLPVDGLVGQPRASEALRFGTRIEKPGFNLFVIGPPGARMSEAVQTMLHKAAEERQSPPDWVYVNNFVDATKPAAIELPAGRAPKFNSAMRSLIEDLKTALPAVFQSEDYQRRRGAIDENFRKQQAEAFSGLREKAGEKGVVILRTPFGFALAPAVNGEVVPPEQFSAWPEAKRNEIEAVIGVLEKDLEHIVRQLPQWEKQRRNEIRALNRESARFAVGQLIDETKAKFNDLPRILSHLEAVRTDLIENVPIFIAKSEDGGDEAPDLQPGAPFDCYEVNVLVTREEGNSTSLSSRSFTPRSAI